MLSPVDEEQAPKKKPYKKKRRDFPSDRRKRPLNQEIEKSAPLVQQWFDKADLARIPPYAPEIVEQICDMMVENDVSLARICKEKLVPGVPSISRVMFWRKCDPRIADALRAAREAQAESKLDDASDWLKKQFYNEDGEFVDAVEAKARAQYARIEIDLRKFEATKLVPRIYGNQEQVHQKRDGDRIIQVMMPEMKDAVKPQEEQKQEQKTLPAQVSFEPAHD
jgi:hypothetical protein